MRPLMPPRSSMSLRRAGPVIGFVIQSRNCDQTVSGTSTGCPGTSTVACSRMSRDDDPTEPRTVTPIALSDELSKPDDPIAEIVVARLEDLARVHTLVEDKELAFEAEPLEVRVIEAEDGLRRHGDCSLTCA
jgi:hypothetical protein